MGGIRNCSLTGLQICSRDFWDTTRTADSRIPQVRTTSMFPPRAQLSPPATPRHRTKAGGADREDPRAPRVIDALRDATVNLSAKRLSRGEGVDGWYPYYAGFSYRFAEAALVALSDGASGCVVLDPWNGSGTTTAAALGLGHSPIGIDLNAATLPLAAAKLTTRAEVKALPAMVRAEIDDAVRSGVRDALPKSDPLSEWLPGRLGSLARVLLSAHSQGDTPSLRPRHALATACYLSVFRGYAVDHVRTNPSWVQPAQRGRPPRNARVIEEILHRADQIAGSADSRPARRVRRTKVVEGDARRLSLPDASIDLVLTSPPYCTRIDYARKTGFEIAALLCLDQASFRTRRDDLMGTTTIRPGNPSRTPGLPDSVSALLEQIARHPSHRSAGYYARNFTQYFDDAFLAMREMSRVLKPGGRAGLVVQTSYYKEVRIDLGELYCALAHESGLEAKVVTRQPIGRSMATRNPFAKSGADRVYTEDVLYLERTTNGHHRR